MEAKYSKGGKRSQNTPPVNTQTPPIIANANREVHSTPRGQHHPDTNTSTGSQLLQQKEKKENQRSTQIKHTLFQQRFTKKKINIFLITK